MLNHFFAFMVVIFVVSLVVDLAGSVFLGLRARLFSDLGIALTLGAALGFNSDVGAIAGALAGGIVFICIYALVSSVTLGIAVRAQSQAVPQPVLADPRFLAALPPASTAIH